MMAVDWVLLPGVGMVPRANLPAGMAVPRAEPVQFDPKNADEVWRLARMLAESDLLPKELRGRPANVAMVMMRGISFGMKALDTLGAINIIDGKMEIGANAMVARVLSSGACEYFVLVRSTREAATWRTRRKTWPKAVCADCKSVFADGTEVCPEHLGIDETDCVGAGNPTVPFSMTFTWTIDEAADLGLVTKGRTAESASRNQWARQPANMLRRRASAMLCREAYQDVCHGLYDHGELSELKVIDLDTGEVVTDADAPATHAPAKRGFKDRIRAKAENAAAAEAPAPDKFWGDAQEPPGGG